MDWWVRAEEIMGPESDLTGPGMFLATTMAISLAGEEDVRLGAGFRIAIQAGHALRSVLPIVTSRIGRLDASSLDRESIVALAARPVDPEVGLLATEDQPEAATVLGPSVTLVHEYVAERFDQVVSVDMPFWGGALALATYQLNKNVGRLDEDLVEPLLRYGFVLRAWEEALGIAVGQSAEATTGEVPSSVPADAPALQSDGTPLDVDDWLNDAAYVCTNEFEPFAERMLEVSTVELLGIQPVVDRYMDKPWEGYEPAVEAGVANARLGYALRNRETQLVDCDGQVREDDPLAALTIERAEKLGLGIKTVVVHQLIRDVLDYGDRDLVYSSTAGTTSEARRDAFERWAQQHYPGDDPRLGHAMTSALMEHGYFLHRLFEIQPDLCGS